MIDRLPKSAHRDGIDVFFTPDGEIEGYGFVVHPLVPMDEAQIVQFIQDLANPPRA